LAEGVLTGAAHLAQEADIMTDGVGAAHVQLSGQPAIAGLGSLFEVERNGRLPRRRFSLPGSVVRGFAQSIKGFCQDSRPLQCPKTVRKQGQLLILVVRRSRNALPGWEGWR
jgi:hypothetical protein